MDEYMICSNDVPAANFYSSIDTAKYKMHDRNHFAMDKSKTSRGDKIKKSNDPFFYDTLKQVDKLSTHRRSPAFK